MYNNIEPHPLALIDYQGQYYQKGEKFHSHFKGRAIPILPYYTKKHKKCSKCLILFLISLFCCLH